MIHWAQARLCPKKPRGSYGSLDKGGGEAVKTQSGIGEHKLTEVKQDVVQFVCQPSKGSTSLSTACFFAESRLGGVAALG